MFFASLQRAGIQFLHALLQHIRVLIYSLHNLIIHLEKKNLLNMHEFEFDYTYLRRDDNAKKTCFLAESLFVFLISSIRGILLFRKKNDVASRGLSLGSQLHT